MKGKKGLGTKETFISTIVILLVLILLIIWLTRFIDNTQKTVNRETCRTGNLAQSAASNIKNDLVQAKCNTFSVEFYSDHVEIDGKTRPVIDVRRQLGVSVREFDELTEDMVNQVLSEELRGCWYQFLEGKTPLWSKSYLGENYFKSPVCFICDEISFDSSLTGREYKGFYDYLKASTMPKSSLTYYDYVMLSPRRCYGKLTPNSCWENEADKKLEEEKNPVLMAGALKKYYIVMLRQGEDASMLDKTDSDTYFSYIFSEKKLDEVCTGGIVRGR